MSEQRMRCLALDAGVISYQEALDLQHRLVELRRRESIDDVLLLLEHPPVITIGRNGGVDQIRVPVEQLRIMGIAVHVTNRGGNITYHGPGQLVGYPILNLHHLRKDAHWYLRTLENVIIAALKVLGIAAGRVKGKTGVWVNGEKIASLGVAIRHWVTMHGFALNIELDLSPFSLINPCGMPDAVMTSVSQQLATQQSRLRPNISVKNEAASAVVHAFGDQFGREMVQGNWEEFRKILKEPETVYEFC